jgi:hypothetical protein
MANEVTNNLEIICEDEKTLNKIRMMIFDEDIHKNVKFTMERMLPKPPLVSKSRGYSEYGYYWAPAIWGTKSDVYDCFITDSGNTITINYLTDWRPNVTWVNLLCCYIEMAITPLSPEEISAISVKLHYYDYMGNFGGFWEWVPNEKPNTNEYSIMEYAKLHDNDLFEWVTEYREFCKSV